MRKLLLGLFTILGLSTSLLLYVVLLDPLWVYVSLGVSALLAFGWIWESRTMLRDFFTRRSTYYGANIGFVLFLVLGILVFLNVLAKDYHWRKDLTRSSMNSLSPQTIKVLRELPQPVKAYYFSSIQEKERGEPLFRNYAYETKKFEYEFVDTVRRPTFVQAMGVGKNETAVLEIAGTNKRVKIDGISEEKLTNGLIQLLRAKEQVVYFLTGHGERSLEGNDPLGYGLLRAELGKQGFTAREWNLFNEGKIPADAAALVVAGPSRAFFPKELEILENWVKAGGQAVFALDLSPADNGLTPGSAQLAKWLETYGLRVSGRMLVDPTSKAANVEPQVLLGFSGSKEHPVTKDFAFSERAANFLFPLTTSLRAEPEGKFRATALVVSSKNAWAESDWGSLKSGLVSYQAGQDERGQMTLAYAVEPAGKEKGPRFVVFGTSTFAADSLLNQVGNRDLFLNALAWLTGDEQLISIRPKETEQLQQFSNATLNLVLLVSVFLTPIFIVLAGVFVWVRRSKL